MIEIDQQYAAHVDQLIGSLAQDHALGRDIDIAMCVCGLEPNRFENRKVRDFVTRMLKIPGKDFDRALHLETIRAELGVLPKTARQFVEAFAKGKRVSARYNGVLRMDEVPYLVREDGSRDYISPDLWDHYEFKTMIRTNFKRQIGFAEFQQSLRVRAAELRLDFNNQTLDDASALWYADICRNRLWQIMGQVDYCDNIDVRERGQANLRLLAETCFYSPDGPDLIVAAFNKFIWQIKRKVEDLPIYDHLMPVILGPQGCGKSTLIRKLLEPIQELWVMADFRQITDDRNITLWRNYVIFLDEMGWASKSDIDTVKNTITAHTLTRRVMRTNATQEVAQNVTFIGAANATELAELIRDATGTRRFISIAMVAQPNRPLINSIDWAEIWQSVDHTADDPMSSFKSILARRQEAERIKTPVEDWLDSINPKLAFAGTSLNNPSRRFASSELHTEFREFEDKRFPGLLKTSLPNFIREMKKHANRPKGFRFLQEKSYIIWEWVDPR